jgi:signal transduction histidine kinase
VINLLTNAVKFTLPGGRVDVTRERWGELVHVKVNDTGRGIAREQQTRIFEPFVQVGRHLGTGEGVGLGLSISRELARGMGGDLTVDSTEGVGSQFTLSLPVAAAGTATARRAASDELRAPAGEAVAGSS